MVDHGARSHAKWSASSTAANWACPGRLALLDGLPEQPENLAAAWGTACHQVAEKCLVNNQEASEFIGRIEATKDHKIEVDEELAETAQEYVDYVRGCSCHGPGDWLKIEQKFSLADLNPPFEAGGTGDAVIYKAALRELEVADLKGGRGVVVEAKGNPQLRTYALGALLANPGLDVEHVTVTIVQPRAPHKDGRIRSETFHVADLIEWTADLLDAMRRAHNAAKQAQTEGWGRRWLHAGDHCKFCPAAGFCPALQSRALEQAHSFFEPVSGDLVVTAPAPNEMAPEQLAKVLDSADLIGDWLNAVRSYAHEQAEAGVVIPGYQLVDKRATRKWKDEDGVPQSLMYQFDLMDDDIYAPRKLRTPAQIEKLLKAEQKKQLAALYSAESSGTNLVSSNKTSRKPTAPRAQQFFSAVEQD